jgi:hypothetical protein
LAARCSKPDSIPSDWVESCNTNVHEIFVPSTFNQKTFADAGVTTPLTVLYEPLDTYRFDLSVALSAPTPSVHSTSPACSSCATCVRQPRDARRASSEFRFSPSASGSGARRSTS